MASRAGAATYRASPNIALVKYWGMRDAALGLPFNSSLSLTLGRIHTTTRVRFDPGLDADRLELNGRLAVGRPREEVARFLDRVRERAGLIAQARVRSRNNFPTASGLASSASGFAALAGAATAAAGLSLDDSELSRLARLGSGSACRSVFGGFVLWEAGRRADGQDCVARQLFPASHWPELVDLVALIRDAPTKAVRSASAMQQSVATSPGYAERLAQIPSRLRRMQRAIGERDADSLFPLVIEECDSFRAVCEGTVPTLDYLTAASRRVLAAVRELNARAGRAVAAYTHDAGAHVHVFTTEGDRASVRRALARLDGVGAVRTLRAGPGGRRVASGP